MDTSNNKLRLSVDLRLLCLLLLVALATCIGLWRPWSDSKTSNDRVIEVTGESTLKDTPDEYSFSPNYQFETETKEAALADLTKKSNEVIAGLKQLGLTDKAIKSNSNGFENPSFPENESNKVSYSLQLTVTVDDQKMVQKVQDYLVSTSPSGSVSPFATFSEAKRKQLEQKGRSAAVADARQKANQSAEELGFKVSSVKSISDTGQNGYDVYPLAQSMRGEAISLGDKSAPSIAVQPGENELRYSVKVTYFIR